MIRNLNEDEQMLLNIIGEEKFKRVQEEMGGFQIYIQKTKVSAQDVKELLDKGKTKRQICKTLDIGFSKYNKLIKEAIHIK